MNAPPAVRHNRHTVCRKNAPHANDRHNIEVPASPRASLNAIFDEDTQVLSTRDYLPLLQDKRGRAPFMMDLLRRMRDRRIDPSVRDQERFYAQVRTPAEVRQWQLDRLNEMWERIGGTISYYGELMGRGAAPRRFATLDEFRRVIPITDRTMVRALGDRMVDPSVPVDFVRTTGGSTAQPVQIPGSNCELSISNANAWQGRGWFGVRPSDKLFMIWGHSHLLGRGVRGWINSRRRELKDRVLGYCRHSAYDLSEAALRRAADTLLRQRPAWIYAYSVALDRFAEVNHARRDEFGALKLKVAVATAESFPRPDSAARVADVLGCPVAMEYGSVETGVMAQQARDGNYFFFWRAHLLEGIASPHLPGCYEILITSLYPRRFPLMRYRIGDLISEDPDSPAFQQRFASVIGRCNDYIVLPGGTQVHSEAFTHAVKEIAGIAQYQVVQSRAGGTIAMKYVSAQPLSDKDEAEVRRRLAIVHPQLSAIRLERVSALAQTISGKSRRIIREDAM